MKKILTAIAGLSLASLLNLSGLNVVEWGRADTGFIAITDVDCNLASNNDFNQGYLKKTEIKEEIKKPINAKKYELFEDSVLNLIEIVKSSQKIINREINKKSVFFTKSGNQYQPGSFIFYTSPSDQSMKKILGFQYFETDKNLITFSIEELFSKISNADAREIKTPGKPVYKQGTTKIFLSRSNVLQDGSLDALIKVEYEGNHNSYLKTYVDSTAKPKAEVDVKWVDAKAVDKYLSLFNSLQELYTNKFNNQ